MTGSQDGLDLFAAFAEELADAARVVTRRYFRTAVTVDSKADESPVTIADRETEARLRDLIARRFPDHGIVGEEHGSDRRDAEFVWVLDPIDGTKAFITGNPLFGTLIALTRGGRSILGVIDMPILGERWLGADGRTAEHIDASGRRPARSRACPSLDGAVLQSTHPDMFAGPDLEAFLRLDREVAMTRYGGDCFSYGQLSSGFIDLVVEAGLQPYDFMALLPVVEGAGGRATDWNGAPLTLDSDGYMLATGDPELIAAASRCLKSS
ncbi:histidinol-phosphatase [Algihabitans albus]|uniref:histidinol-phosphatase n=1 Tax=Algihabitans albus TaxID=2164067 RepID=UPI000E5CEB8D|nr:histidinol-phosphatase [Algihabitans albus]